jgi:hypothetical protein
MWQGDRGDARAAQRVGEGRGLELEMQGMLE